MATATPVDPNITRRAVIAATTGNALEFYDFVTFTFFAIQIGKVFFPSTDPFVSLMASLATFGIGFVSRPLGAWAIGIYADRHGRKPAMLLSMAMMGMSVGVLALTPPYAMIGIAAPVIVVLARLAQGFALGGEVGCTTSYMLECAAPDRRALVVSWQPASQSIASSAGSLIGLALSLLLTPQQLADWGWRVALLAGTVIVPFSLAVRHSLPETLHDPEERPIPPPSAANPQASTRPSARIVVLGMAIMGGSTISTYLFNYMATYGQATLGFSAAISLGATLAVNVARFFASLSGGWLGDRFGRRPPAILSWTLFLVLMVPAFALLTSAHDPALFIGLSALLAALAVLPTGPLFTAISESLPKPVRARGFALIYALPTTVLGGTTQLIIAWLLKTTGNPMSVAWFMAATAAISLAAMLLLHETAPARRRLQLA
jgi:MFS family permease